MRQVEELAALIERFAPTDGVHMTPIPRLKVVRLSQPSEPMHGLHEPALCIIAQGAKQVILGDRIYRYDAAHCLVVSLDLPVIGQVIEATPDKPYLCVKLGSTRSPSVRSYWSRRLSPSGSCYPARV